MAHAPGRLGLQPGTIGSPISVITNSFAVKSLPTSIFYQYDEFPDFQELPKRHRTLELIDKLQTQEAALFNPRAAYDGQRNLFRSKQLDLPNNGATFRVFMGNPPSTAPPGGRSRAKPIVIKITKVAEIDPRSILAVINGQGGHNSQSQTTMAILNILVRMKPIMTYPSNAKSFFSSETTMRLGGGLELWRGLFQSVRPTLHRLLVNIDIATAVMYNRGSLVNLILAFLNIRDARDLSPDRLKPVTVKRLSSFLKNLAVAPIVPSRPGPLRFGRRIKKVVMDSADHYSFYNDKEGESMTITAHYYRAYRYRLGLGGVICVDVGKDIVFPIEVLEVKEGQMYKKTLPPALAAGALKFSTQKPNERITAIEQGTKLLGYGDSDFLRQAGMTIDERLISVKARVLSPPPIQWGGRQRPDIPRGGAWNVVGKQLYMPARVKAWAVVVYDPNLDTNQVHHFVKKFADACILLGKCFPNYPPQILPGRPGADDKGHHEDMERAGVAAIQSFDSEFQSNDSKRPTFILVILPDSAIEIRTSVKSWGDCIRGCPTQCMKSGRLVRANDQYCNNLALKVNTKIGGVNSILSASADAMVWLAKAPTMIIGADVSHASPGSDHPSITGLVSSVDENFCQYVASTKVQEQRVEIIAELDAMVENAVENFYMFWKMMRGCTVVPHHIIFYRDGVSEGQFEEVGQKEIQQIKDCLAKLWKTRQLPGSPPKLTFIVVVKKHHIRFFPRDNRDADKSGNCPPGMVVDEEIVNPVDYDFFLQSHGGLLGTSRPSHYSVIEDGNNLGANMLQSISYALCHVYARATRSVSIPAPVYYADIVCARGRFHSKLIHDGGDSTGSVTSGGPIPLEEHKNAFRPIADGMKNSMYFM
ncbi:Piwi-domain-containing protein [Ramaria rubella]|nr:Piwi-domain-containing protein [Ramaria rubella]